MNRRYRRAQDAAQRRQDRRQSVGQAWAELAADQIIAAGPAMTGERMECEVGVVVGRQLHNLAPAILPAEFSRQIILLRPLDFDGIQIAHTCTGPLARCDGWMFAYEQLAFVFRGAFVGDENQYYQGIKN